MFLVLLASIMQADMALSRITLAAATGGRVLPLVKNDTCFANKK